MYLRGATSVQGLRIGRGSSLDIHSLCIHGYAPVPYVIIGPVLWGCQTGQVWKQVAEQLATESFARNNSPGTGSSHSLAQELFLGQFFGRGMILVTVPGLFRRGKRQQH